MRIATTFEFCLVFSLATSFLLPNSLSAQDANQAPPENIQLHLESIVVPAIQANNSVAIVQGIMPLLKSANAGLFETTSSWFASQGFDRLEKYLSTHRANLVHDQQSHLVKEPSVWELMVLLPGIDRQVSDFLADLQEEPIMRDRLEIPESDLDYQELFWQVETKEGDIRYQLTAANYAKAQFDRHQRVFQKRADKLNREQARVINEQHLQSTIDKATSALRTLQERMIELRFYRLEDAVETLRSSPQITDRLRAAIAMINESKILLHTFSELEGYAFQSPNLVNVDLTEQINEMVAEGRHAAGGLVEKAEALHLGLMWWTRGRYGEGPLAEGLLKYPVARRNEQAQMDLLMPNKKPVPQDPLVKDNERIPYYPRRHYYTWMLEQRPIDSGYNDPYTISDETVTGSSTILFDQPITRRVYGCGRPPQTYQVFGTEQIEYTTTSFQRQTIDRSIPPADRDFVNQIVGYYEYAKSLGYLTALVNQSSPEELEAYNTIIKERDEFNVFVGLASMFQGERARLQAQPVESDRLRRGLDWVMALARLELAANIAAYSQEGFRISALQATDFERPALREVLLDDLRSHLFAMQNYLDRNRQQVKQTRWLDRDFPAQYRRVKMIAAMLLAVEQLYGDQLSDVERAELGHLQETAEEMTRSIDAMATALTVPQHFDGPAQTTQGTRSREIRSRPSLGSGNR